MTKAKINKAIRHIGLEIQNKRGSGYSYFTSIRHGHQIGQSVYYCYLNSIPLERWLCEAKEAILDHRLNGSPFSYVTITKKRQLNEG